MINKDIETIIWIQTSFLGDIIISTAAMNLAKIKFPHAKQILITTEIGKNALKDEKYLDSIIVFEKRSSGMLQAFTKLKRELKAQNFARETAVTLIPHRSLRSSLLGLYLGFRSIGYRESAGSFLLTERVPRIAVLHEAHRIGLLLENIGVPRNEILESKPVLQQHQGNLQKPSSIRWIGVAPGSKWGTKMWPIESFAKLVNQLCSDPQNQILLLGSPDEKQLSQKIMAGAAKPNQIIDLIGKTSLDELRSIYPQLSIMVTGDSSPLHYATAFNIPTVAIFGATVPSMGFGPLSTKFKVVENLDLACRPCSDHGPQTCPLSHFRCMRELSVDVVKNAIMATY